jgi:hypothetical protein
MNCTELAARLEQFQPDTSARDIARTLLLVANDVDNLEALSTKDQLAQAWRQANMRLQLASDQHAAMTQELEDLANSDPRKFTPDQIWVLLRAIKVQSQILQMYAGQPAIDV